MLSIGLFAFDHYVIPDANKTQDAIRAQIKGRPTQTYLRPDRKWIFGTGSSRIYYYKYFDPAEGVMVDVHVYELEPDTFRLTAPHLRRARALGTRAERLDLPGWMVAGFQKWKRVSLQSIQGPDLHVSGDAGASKLLSEGSQAGQADELPKNLMRTSANSSKADSIQSAFRCSSKEVRHSAVRHNHGAHLGSVRLHRSESGGYGRYRGQFRDRDRVLGA